MKFLRMRFSVLENVPTSDDIIFKLSRGSQRPYGAKSKQSDFYIFFLLNWTPHSYQHMLGSI